MNMDDKAYIFDLIGIMQKNEKNNEFVMRAVSM